MNLRHFNGLVNIDRLINYCSFSTQTAESTDYIGSRELWVSKRLESDSLHLFTLQTNSHQ